MNNNFSGYVGIVDIHIKRLEFALSHLKNIMPVDESGIKNMSDEAFMYFEVLTNRFSKLQDYLGGKIFDLCLQINKENYTNMSMIDKLNKLEKIGVIESVELWDELRELRNHLTHEYPNHPEITAKYLNYTYNLSPQLISLAKYTISLLGEPKT